jgi:transposase
LSPVGPIAHVAADLGLPAETLRKRVRQAEVDQGRRQRLSSTEREKIRKLRNDVVELRRANEILRWAHEAVHQRRRAGTLSRRSP